HRAALAAGILCAGWCPPDRACEYGPIPPEFPLQPTPQKSSLHALHVPRGLRTEWNVRDSDATLILRPANLSLPDSETDWTIECAQSLGRPLLVVDPADFAAQQIVRPWLESEKIRILNVAGPSESDSPGIGEVAYQFLLTLFQQ